MDGHIRFTDVQLLNLSYLMAIQACTRKDPVAACYKYRLSAEQVQTVAELGTEKIHELIAHFGHECLFTPRDDLLRLLMLPPALVVTFSSVSAPPPPTHSTTPVERRRMIRL